MSARSHLRAASRVFVVWATAASAASAAAPAQAVSSGGVPPWSPLVPIAELPAATLASDLPLPGLLSRPAPRVGLFWTAGVPAGLPWDVASRRTAFAATARGASGTYRRPLDPGSERAQSVGGETWGPLGARGAGLGRVTFRRRGAEDGAFANLNLPYRSEPYSAADTVGERKSGIGVEIEGAGGWRLGHLALGLGLGYVQSEHRTVESAVPILLRWSVPGAAAGAAWDFGPSLRIAAYGRWQQEVEFVSILSIAAGSRVYRFAGYAEPTPINLVATFWNRRWERAARAGGIAATGEVFGLTWAGFAQRETREAKNFDVTGTGGRIDRWDADGWAAGLSAQRRLGPVIVTVDARYQSVDGEALLADLTDVVYRARDRRLALETDVRTQPGKRWKAAAVFGLTRDIRRRSDALVELGSDLAAWRPVGAFEIARHFGSFAAALAVAQGEHNPAGAIPDQNSLGPIYRKWIAPAVGYDATVASARAFEATLNWQARSTTTIWLGARHVSASAGGGVSGFPGRATGDRKRWSLGVGVIGGAF